MSEPIKRYKWTSMRHELREVETTYEELLDTFPAGGDDVVRPLVLRCQRYEELLAAYRELARAYSEATSSVSSIKRRSRARAKIKELEAGR